VTAAAGVNDFGYRSVPLLAGLLSACLFTVIMVWAPLLMT